MNEDLQELADFLGIDEKDLVGPPGKDGYTPVKGVDYFDGKDGENYVLSKKDKKEIAALIDVPVVEKIIEKTEIIKEQPIVTEKIIENKDTAEDIRNKLELLQGEDRLDKSAIRGLEEAIGKETIRVVGGVQGVKEIIAGTNVTVDNSNLGYPVISVSGAGPGATDWGDIGGTLSAQTDLQTALDGKVDENTAITGATKTKVTYDSKGLVTGGADATTADIADSTNKRYVTDAQLTVLGNTSGTNTGDQTSIAGITGTRAQFDTALTDGNFLYTGDITQYTDENAQDAVGNVVGAGLSYNDATGSISCTITQYTDEMAQDAVGNVVGNGLDYDDTTGAISVDETELTATSLSGFTEGAQDAVGAMVDSSLTYVDGTPLLQRAALTGAITASAGSNTTSLGSFTLSQLNTAVSDANIIPEAGGTFTGDISVPDEAYGAGWNGSLEVPTKNALYDILVTLGANAITRTIVTTTGDVTMDADTAVDYVYIRNSEHQITFPTAVGNTNRYTIKNRHTTPMTPLTTNSQTIDGRSQTLATSPNALVIYPNEAYDFLSDNSNWYTI